MSHEVGYRLDDRPRSFDMARQTFADLPGWTFEVDEVSANVYRVTAMDDAGRRTEQSGTDPDALIDEARQWAARHQQDVPRPKFAG